MEKRQVSTPQLFLIAGTRVALGIGAGLLLAGRLDDQRRQRLGRILLGVGIGSTFPLARSVFRRPRIRSEAGMAA